MKEILRRFERHQDAAIFKSVFGADNAGDQEASVAGSDMSTNGGVQEVRGTFSQNDPIKIGAEGFFAAGQPRSVLIARGVRSRQSR